MANEFNIWENEDELVLESYSKNNFLIKDNKKVETDLCFIFFSSNAIYFPNEKEYFYEAIVKNDRYEWMNICDNYFVKRRVRKAIFVRDIYKQYYIKGINKRLNSVDELVSMLVELTDGFKVVTVGTSSGGYMAALVGCKLHAEYVLDFAGQFILNTEKGKFVCDAIKQGYKYTSIVNLIEKSNVPIFYFLPNENESDCIQYQNMEGVSNIYTFSIIEKRHGIPISILDIPGVLLNDKETMYALYSKCKGKKISRIKFHFMQKKFWVSMLFGARMLLRTIFKHK